MNRNELDELPPVLDVPTAAKVLGIGRSLGYDLVRHGDWPTPVLHVGKLIRIPSAPLLALLSKQPEVTLHADFGERLRA